MTMTIYCATVRTNCTGTASVVSETTDARDPFPRATSTATGLAFQVEQPPPAGVVSHLVMAL